MVSEQEIRDALAVEKAAHEAYAVAQRHREQLQITRACEEYKVGIGMFVKDKRGRTGVVSRVKPWADGRPWVVAREIKKDGSQSKRELNMFNDWTVIADEPAHS
jgi:hypothetical protein